MVCQVLAFQTGSFAQYHQVLPMPVGREDVTPNHRRCLEGALVLDKEPPSRFLSSAKRLCPNL